VGSTTKELEQGPGGSMAVIPNQNNFMLERHVTQKPLSSIHGIKEVSSLLFPARLHPDDVSTASIVAKGNEIVKQKRSTPSHDPFPRGLRPTLQTLHVLIVFLFNGHLTIPQGCSAIIVGTLTAFSV
jgi:hypothetical protein